jgi:membrane associated rhomboid family serine protease
MNYYNPNFNNQQQNPLNELKNFFRSKNLLVKLIIINSVVWLLLMFLEVLFDLFNSSFTEIAVEWLAVPASVSNLMVKPWTLLTYMFLHVDFWHILFNMLWLYWFGKIFSEYLNERQLLSTYLLGGIAGGVFYILSFNIFPKFQDAYLQSIALGASASVMAIVVSISYYVPNYRIYLLFFGPVRIIYIALFSIILDVIMIRSSNSGGHLAHLGGAMWGFFFITMLKKGIDMSRWLFYLDINRFIQRLKRPKKSSFRNVHSNKRPVSDDDYNLWKKQNQEKIDGILDKISRSGYESLTKEEKEFLFHNSNNKK